MYLGGDTVIPDEDIIFIVPRETTQISRDTRACIFEATKGRMRNASDIQKCYVLCERDGRYSVCTSAITPEKLTERNDRTRL